MPVALISTRTSPAFGPSRSSSTISSGFFASKAIAARVFMAESRFASRFDCSTLVAHAGIFGLGIGFGFVFMLCRAHGSKCIVGARPQVDVDIIHVAGHVRIIAEGWHHVLLRRADVLPAAGDDGQE